MSSVNFSVNNLENEGVDIENIEISSSDLSCSESIDISSSEISLNNECDITTSDFEFSSVAIDSKELSLGTRNLSSVNIKVISGSIGEDGDGIRKIEGEEYSEGDGGTILRIVLSSGRITTVLLKNGKQGPKGDKGEDGAPGLDADIEGANVAIDSANEAAASANASASLANSAAEEANAAAEAASQAAESASNVDVSIDGSDLTITNKDGESKTVNVRGQDGAQGPEGPQGIPGTGAITSLNEYTLAEYMDLKNRGLLNNSFYTVYKNGELYRMYLGETLVAKKAESGEQVTLGMAYPLVFPIIFA